MVKKSEWQQKVGYFFIQPQKELLCENNKVAFETGSGLGRIALWKRGRILTQPPVRPRNSQQKRGKVFSKQSRNSVWYNTYSVSRNLKLQQQQQSLFSFNFSLRARRLLVLVHVVERRIDLILGWFSNRTGTSVDNGARKSNNWLTNGRAANWAPEVVFSPFRALSRRQLTFPSCC